jgi:hypothetical protein
VRTGEAERPYDLADTSGLFPPPIPSPSARIEREDAVALTVEGRRELAPR